MWLAWWMVHDDSHSTLRDSADSISRRAGAIPMAAVPAMANKANSNPRGLRKNLKNWRHTRVSWDKLPGLARKPRVHSNDDPRCHRPQDPEPPADRRPHDHAGARRQGRAVG